MTNSAILFAVFTDYGWCFRGASFVAGLIPVCTVVEVRSVVEILVNELKVLRTLGEAPKKRRTPAKVSND